jgi:dihydrofolate reductase
MDIIYYAAASLDGYIATADGGVEWLDAYDGEEGDYGFADFYASVDALVMGSKTYEFALAQPEWMAPDRPSWVFTRRDLRQAHPSVHLTAEDPADVADSRQRHSSLRPPH